LRRASNCYKNACTRSDDLRRAAGLIVRYAKKNPGQPELFVRCLFAGVTTLVKAGAPDSGTCQSWML